MAAGSSSDDGNGTHIDTMTFAQMMKLQQSERSLAPSAITSSSRYSGSSFGREVPADSEASSSTHSRSLQQGPRLQHTSVRKVDPVTMQGSILTSGPFDAKKALGGMSLTSLFEEDDDGAAFEDWTSPLPEDYEMIHKEGLSRPLYLYKEPPYPTRTFFPGDPCALDHGRPTTLPYDHVGTQWAAEHQPKTDSAQNTKHAGNIDLFANMTIYNGYPHVFRPKQRVRPDTKRGEKSRAGEVFGKVFQSFKSRITSFAASRTQSNVLKSPIGMSMCIHGSTHDFAASTYAIANVLYSTSNVTGVHETTVKVPNNAAKAPFLQNARTVKVVGDPDRATMIEDFMSSKIFAKSSSEESNDVQSPIRNNLKNRGDSKTLHPLLAETFDPISRHSSRRPGFVPDTPIEEMPRFDEEYPRPEDLFDDVSEHELSTARRDNYLEAARAANNLYRRPYEDLEYDDDLDGNFDNDSPVEQYFKNIEDAVARYKGVPEHRRAWADNEIPRLNDKLDRDHRLSDAIIVDTFPHDAHTSWRATERTDVNTIHTSYERFSREVGGNAGYQDAAGCLMEELERRRNGTELGRRRIVKDGLPSTTENST